MSGSSQSAEDRTEAGSQRHIDQAREAGNVPLSREVATFASLAGVVTILIAGSPVAIRELSRDLAVFVAQADQPQLAGQAGPRIVELGLLGGVAPLLSIAALAGAAAVLLQTNF